MIHQLHNRIQRFIAITFKIKNIYELTHKCERIDKSMIQLNKTKRVVNKINQQKQRRVVILNVIFLNVIFFSKTFVLISFSQKILLQSKSRLFNFSSNVTLRLINKKTLIFFKQKRCFKCKELEHITSTCKSEFKFMSTNLKEIVKLFDSKNQNSFSSTRKKTMKICLYQHHFYEFFFCSM